MTPTTRRIVNTSHVVVWFLLAVAVVTDPSLLLPMVVVGCILTAWAEYVATW